MSKITKFLVASLSVLGAYYSFTQNEDILEVEHAEGDVAPWIQEECTPQLELGCAVFIEQTVVMCSKAFETEGKDIVADIKCAKDLLADKKLCWPCICALANKKEWHVIGC